MMTVYEQLLAYLGKSLRKIETQGSRLFQNRDDCCSSRQGNVNTPITEVEQGTSDIISEIIEIHGKRKSKKKV